MKFSWIKVGLVVLLLLVVFLSVVFWNPIVNWTTVTFSRARIQGFLEQMGPFAPLVFIGLQALQVVIAPIPMQFFGILGAIVFGAVWGTIYSLIGLTIGSFIAIWLARVFGRKLVQRFVEKEILGKFDHLAEKGGLLVFFMIFLLPALPDDAICFIAGLTALPISALVLVAFLGRLPGLLALNLVGEQIWYGKDGTLTIIILTLVVIAVGLAFIFKPQIENLFVKLRHQEDDASEAEEEPPTSERIQKP